MFTYIPEKKLFHLTNGEISLCFALVSDNPSGEELCLTHLGGALTNPACTLNRLDLHEGASFDSLRQIEPYACPTDGRGDYRMPMICAKDEKNQRCTELYFSAYEYAKGKPHLNGLPQTYIEEENEAETLTFVLTDPVTGLVCRLSYTLFAGRNAFASSCKLVNTGSGCLMLQNASSLCIALPGHYDLLHLAGGWGKERTVQRVKPSQLVRQISSVRGASGHEHNPFAAMLSGDATEFSGECIGVSLVYSGDFAISVEENGFDQTRLVAGLNPRSFNWMLHSGEEFQTPEAVCVWSDHGLNGMSQTYHALYAKRLCRGLWRDRVRPLLINNWEGTYFDFDHEKIMSIARAAREIGIEMLVLDDGWFGKRDDDHSSLGDWFVNKRKLPKGIDGLCREINALGMKFGLWFEPEMISPVSELYDAHPDWCLHVPGRPRSQSRNQLILDMSRKDVQDYVIDSVCAVLESANIEYVKWDMNRNFKEAGSDLLENQGELSHRYMLGLYRVLESITSRFPDILFESCSGGGGRFDPGMLYYMPQTWTSDNTDAGMRLEIQYGTSMVYPASAISAHVPKEHNGAGDRHHSVKMRGDVALGGNFGYELDLSVQSPKELALMKEQIIQVKRLRETTARGVFTRLASPFEGNIASWQFADNHRVIFCAYKILARVNPGPVYIRLHDIPKGEYADEEGNVYSHLDLMNAGVRCEFIQHDFVSFVKVFEKI